MKSHECRACKAPLEHSFVNLGMSPFSNNYVPMARANEGETSYPLHVFICDKCWLAQLGEFEDPGNIFSAEYAYFSSMSKGWLAHAKKYSDDMIARFNLGKDAHIAEVASNDGYLLQYFVQQGMTVTGIEPTANTAKAAEDKGVHSEVCFFGESTAKDIAQKRGKADLMAANNVLAHVPDIHDFVEGFAQMLKPEGVLTFEFPHLMQLIRHNQFDTVYHEHFSYLAVKPVQQVLKAHGLRIFDIQEQPTHGGSLRVFVCLDGAAHAETPAVADMIAQETKDGVYELATYLNFQSRVVNVKNDVWEFLIKAQREGKTVAGYGAAAKGNTLLNYCGVGVEHLQFVVDLAPSKQNTLLPGSRIPVYHPDEIMARKPDYVFILPWNIKQEVMTQMAGIREWGGQFVTAIPQLDVV